MKGNYYCEGLKRRNYCERKPSFMARNCQKTCDKKCQQKGNGGNSGNSGEEINVYFTFLKIFLGFL